MKNDLTVAIFGHDQLESIGKFSDHLALLNSMKLINIGELAEQAISKTTDIERCDACNEGFDLVNGVEIKHAQTHERNIKGSTLKSWISKRNKTGPIYAVVSESITAQQYYFKFPYDYYSQYDGNAFCVPFEVDGTPRRFNKRWTYITNPWRFEIKEGYGELCKQAKAENGESS